MPLPNNYLKYPENVQEPKKIILDSRTYTLHGYTFKGLRDFYLFLKKNPEINYEIFSRNRLASEKKDFDFAGQPYKVAVENLLKEMDPGYQEYLRIQRQIKAKAGQAHKYKTIKTVAGGNVDPVAYTAGSPEIYRAGRLTKRPKFITVDTQVAYYCGTTKQQVFNRALIITSIIKALERNGYVVDINSFMVAQCESEIIKAIFEIKKPGQHMNYQTLYKSLVDVEFFRRLCFRLIEISDVEEAWNFGYGETSGESRVRKLLHLKDSDIYFDQPSEMDISGDEIGKDFERVAEHLHLEQYIDIDREKESLRRSVKVIKR